MGEESLEVSSSQEGKHLVLSGLGGAEKMLEMLLV